jgi:hypothetical protein
MMVHYKEFGTEAKGIVKFSRQAKKKPFFATSGQTLNEKRFEYLELPAIYSKVYIFHLFLGASALEHLLFQKYFRGKHVHTPDARLAV